MKHNPSHTKPQLIFCVRTPKLKATGPKMRKEGALWKDTVGLVLWVSGAEAGEEWLAI